MPKQIEAWKQRYYDAHNLHISKIAPSVIKDGLYTLPSVPKVATANGLTQFICNYINWLGYRATRISSAGRVIKSQRGSIYIPSTTRRGTADISSTIKGRSVMWEIKVGNDKPSKFQLEEQAKERAAGGEYFFVGSPLEFFLLFDELL